MKFFRIFAQLPILQYPGRVSSGQTQNDARRSGIVRRNAKCRDLEDCHPLRDDFFVDGETNARTDDVCVRIGQPSAEQRLPNVRRRKNVPALN